MKISSHRAPEGMLKGKEQAVFCARMAFDAALHANAKKRQKK